MHMLKYIEKQKFLLYEFINTATFSLHQYEQLIKLNNKNYLFIHNAL